MAKLGDAYQDAVAEVAQAIDPLARVEVGSWINGPDGRRDMDVTIRSSASGVPRVILIECKDWGRPIGIGSIDALESKRRDLKLSVAMICSNSGFTADALRKAARVGIPAISALAENDKRIRVEVLQEIYTRRIAFQHSIHTWHTADKNVQFPPGTHEKELTFNGKLLAAWVHNRAGMIAYVSGKSRKLVAKFKFRRAIQIRANDADIWVIGVDLNLAFTVQWFSQVVRVDASSGIYDYLRQRTILGSGAQQLQYKDVDFNKWVPLAEVPPHLQEYRGQHPTQKNEVAIGPLTLIRGIDQYEMTQVPDLDSQIESEEIIDIVE